MVEILPTLFANPFARRLRMTRTAKKTMLAAFLIAVMPMAQADNHERLMEILDARSDEAKSRDAYRHPAETLQLFGIEEGMTVIDALPGSWYGNILAPLLGEDGRYIGVGYGEWYYRNRYGDD
jgi:predicted methyltransferase